MKKVVTLGELVLRLSSPSHQRLDQASSFDIIFGGAEANVALALANYGYNTYLISKLPKNDIGQMGVNSLRRYGVNTDYIRRGGDRMGLYFSETGSSMRPSNIIYDRSGSAISEASIDEFDFDKIFSDADWFHFSGIMPALGPQARRLTEEALKAAARYGVTVSADFNYRRSLWDIKEAHRVMVDLMQYVDVCFDSHNTLLYNNEDISYSHQELSSSDFEEVFKELVDKFNFKYVINSRRKSYSASDNGWSAYAYDRDKAAFYQSKEHHLRIVDRVGGGDAYVSGVIYGLLEGKDLKDALEFGVAASALKHTIHGDYNLVSVDEVEDLLNRIA